MTAALGDVEWLLAHTLPVVGERAAALESWSNILRALGMGREDVDATLGVAEAYWRARAYEDERCGACGQKHGGL